MRSCSSEKQKLPEECVKVLPFRTVCFSPSFHVARQKLSPEKVYHVLVAPCFDKKLEAVREEFYNSLLETRDVDCVLTSGSLFSRPTDACLQKCSTYRFIITIKNGKYNLFFLFQHGSRVKKTAQLTDGSVCSDQTVSRADVNKYGSRLFNCVLQFVTVFIWKTLGVSFGGNTRKFLTSLPCWNRAMHIQPAWLPKQTQRLRLHHTQTLSCHITVQNIVSLFLLCRTNSQPRPLTLSLRGNSSVRIFKRHKGDPTLIQPFHIEAWLKTHVNIVFSLRCIRTITSISHVTSASPACFVRPAEIFCEQRNQTNSCWFHFIPCQFVGSPSRSERRK